MWIAIVAFLYALFVPPAAGEPSIFEGFIATILGLWSDVAPAAAKMASFIDQIPAMIMLFFGAA
jgi:hypothetical protein